MALRKLEEDLAFVQKLDNEPNDVAGMTAEELKSWFDKAPQAIQKYINEVLIPDIETMAVPGTGDFKADGSVKMLGSINMNGNRAVQLGAPVAGGDAANKDYVDKVRKEAVNNREGQPNGLATLDEGGKLPNEQLPTYTMDETFGGETKEAYGLDKDAVPDHAFRTILDRMGAIGNIKSLVVDRIDESMTWVAPKATGQWFKVFTVGGGGGGGGGYEYDTNNGYYCGGAGGGGGHVVIQELTIPEGTEVEIVCGAAGATGTSGSYNQVTAGGDGGATLFGSYLSAAGGKGGGAGNAYGSIGGDGGAGGGAGGHEDGYHVEEDRNNSKGGSGGMYGGGGGGHLSGGNGGLYGGGGAGRYQKGSDGEYSGQRGVFAFAEHLGKEMICSGKAGAYSGAGYGGNGGADNTGGGGGFGGSGGDGNGESGGGGGSYGGNGGAAGSDYSTKASTGGGGGGLFCNGGNGGGYTGGQGGGIDSTGGGGCYILYFREVG